MTDTTDTIRHAVARELHAALQSDRVFALADIAIAAHLAALEAAGLVVVQRVPPDSAWQPGDASNQETGR